MMHKDVTLAPLEVTQPEDLLRLRAYIWADPLERLRNTDATIALAPPCPAKANASG